jgi:2-polyprenyl-3-methyl-5-hydroxy-6-metoxy-1,4-benzoquinol methylase
MDDKTGKFSQYLEDVKCNLCGGNDYDVIIPDKYEKLDAADFARIYRSSGDDILFDQLVRCKKCGLEYLNPRFRSGLILEGYSEGSDETFISQISAREKTFDKCLKLIEKLAPERGKIFDVGTAGGSFLGVAKRRGWDAEGCEPNKWLAKWGSEHYGVTIHPGTIFDVKLKDNSYDVVTLWDVLEHTPDPKAVLLECRRILKPNGLLIINYPDIGASISRLMGGKWVFLLSVHLYYFTFATIKKILEISGFKLLKSKKHWQTLELGYIFFRMKPYSSFVSNVGSRITELLRLKNAQIPYWMGQMLVVARKYDR